MSKRLSGREPKRKATHQNGSPFAELLGRHPVGPKVPAPEASASEKRTGKSADPAFTKLTVYIRRETHQEVKIRLLQERAGRDVSELTEDLFSEWLNRKA